MTSFDLVTKSINYLRGRTDECNPSCLDLGSELGILGKEPVAVGPSE
jgi:hypothetical protein